MRAKPTKQQPGRSRFVAVVQDECVFDIKMLGEQQLAEGAPLMCVVDDMRMSLTFKGALLCQGEGDYICVIYI